MKVFSRQPRTPDNLVLPQDNLLASSNLFIALPEIGFAAFKLSGLALLNGVHNLSDITYMRQLGGIRAQLSTEQQEGDTNSDNTPTKLQKLGQSMNHFVAGRGKDARKNSYRLMSWSALGAAVISAYGVANTLAVGNDHQEEHALDASYGHVGTTLASVAIAGGLTWLGEKFKRLTTEQRQTNLELAKDIDDFSTHAKLDLVSSSAAFIGAGLHPMGLGLVDQTAGVLLSSYQAVKFWPSKKNLERGLAHSHDDHQTGPCHHHHHHSDLKSVMAKAREKFTAPRKRLGGMALAITATLTLLSGSAAENDVRPNTGPPIISAPDFTNPPDRRQQKTIMPEAFSKTCTTVKEGDSIWEITSRQIEDAAGRAATPAETNAAALINAQNNAKTLPNPDKIMPGDCLKLLSGMALEKISNAAPAKESGLARALQRVNQHSTWREALPSDDLRLAVEKLSAA